VLTIYTIGHSNHPLERFLELLKKHGIELVVDVRSRPYSRYVPHFNRRALENALKREGIEYHFLGDKLGGQPEDEAFRRKDGTVDYGRLLRSPRLREGIGEVIALAARFRLVLLCGEEDPGKCHRKRLLAPLFRERGIKVLHIRGDGAIDRTDEVFPTLPLKG
jgi:uncharacterized protein (DUF488 family)